MTKIIVVGSGIIGLSSALFLSLSGFRVSLITKNPEEAVSWVAGGMLAPFSEGLEGVLFEFSYRSLKEYPSYVELIREVSGQRIDLWMEGINRVVLKGEEDTLRKARRYIKEGFKAEILTPKANLSDSVDCVIHYAEEGWVDVPMLMDALLFAINKKGVEFITDNIHKVIMEDKKVIRLEGVKNKYEGDFYVFCTGTWTRDLFDLPVFPVKGQALKVKYPHVDRVYYSLISYIIPRSKYVYIGATSEKQNTDLQVSLEGIKTLSENAIRVMPSIGSAQFLSAVVGLRPATPDELPIFDLGENYMLLTGHYRNGILHAPMTVRVLQDYLLKGEKSHYLEYFSPERFKNP